jgi:hypothetical protein
LPKKNPIQSYHSVTCEYADEFKIFALHDEEVQAQIFNHYNKKEVVQRATAEWEA